MREYDIRFDSHNTASDFPSPLPKKITTYVVEPPRITPDTGVMHVAQGWTGNRLSYQPLMREFSQRYNLICVATEYRQGGYDFDPEKGVGFLTPYDLSNLQVIDCLNGLRSVLNLFPQASRQRIIAFGGSQGGHIALLMSVFCPDTFALVIAMCPLTHVEERHARWSSRDFSADELAVRDVGRAAHRIKCPVVLAHGTADEVLPDEHTRRIEKILAENNRKFRVKYYAGGKHSLEPVTNRTEATKELADDWLRDCRNSATDDFSAGSRIAIPCVTKTFFCDWSKDPDSPELCGWKEE